MSCVYFRHSPYGPGLEVHLHRRRRDWRLGVRWGRSNGRSRLWAHLPGLALEIAW